MNCPKCGGNNLTVIDTVSDIDDEVYRCRRCNDCGGKFHTVEFEIESTDKVINIFRHAHNVKAAKSRNDRKARGLYGPVVTFRKNEF